MSLDILLFQRLIAHPAVDSNSEGEQDGHDDGEEIVIRHVIA